jgi:hypothetical protein
MRFRMFLIMVAVHKLSVILVMSTCTGRLVIGTGTGWLREEQCWSRFCEKNMGYEPEKFESERTE